MNRQCAFRWLWRVLALLVVIAVAASLTVVWLLSGSRMSYSGEQQVAGLEHPVDVNFDKQARPFVDATTLPDAIFAQGYLHARERLWQMDLLRRAGRARLAELLGRDVLETDRGLWLAGVPELAGNLMGNASSRLSRLVDAYTDGVNAALAEMRRPPPEYLLLGVEPTNWEAIDSFAVGAIMAFDSASNFDAELLRYNLAAVLPADMWRIFNRTSEHDPDFPYAWSEQPAGPAESAGPNDPVGTGARREPGGGLAWLRAVTPSSRPPSGSIRFGSNGWVVSPRRAAGDSALFAFDSHDPVGLPNLFYEVHLFFGDRRQLRGWSVPGLPGVINGFNAHRAWGFTNIGDTQDLVELTPVEGQPGRFAAGNSIYQARRQTRRFRVHGGEPVEYERWITPNGPVVSENPTLALRWVAQDLAGAGLDALMNMALAQSTTEFEEAMKGFPAPSANITWADREARIGLRTIGRLPVRKHGNGLWPVEDPGSDIWSGRVPVSAMPAMIDPQAGFAAAANARVHDASWPYTVSHDNAPGWRMRRIRNFLSSRSDHDLDSMAELQTDHYNVQAERDGPRMLRLLPDRQQLDPVTHDALAVLQEWLDRPVNRPDAAGALIFESWYVALIEQLFGPPLDDELYRTLLGQRYIVNQAVDALLDSPDSPWWGGDASALMISALNQAVARLETDLGGNPAGWRLDQLQELTFRHAFSDAEIPFLPHLLDRGPFGVGGGHATVGRAGHMYTAPFKVRYAATVRTVIKLGAPFEVRAVIPGGQSGRFYSTHYDDQLESWLEGEYFQLPAKASEVDGRRLRLIPSQGTP